MNIFPAQPFDIDAIMKIERQAFIPQVQEKKRVFERRLKVFPEGGLILSDSGEKAVAEHGGALTCGYLCAERWTDLPDFSRDERFSRRFTLGHNIKDTHTKDGRFLYISSFALLREYQGRGLGKKFFKSSLEAFAGAFGNLEKFVVLVDGEWKAALEIYRSLGFSEVSRIPEFFPTLQKKVFSSALILVADAKNFLQPDEQKEPANVWAGLRI